MKQTHTARFGGLAAAVLCVAAVVWVAVTTLIQPAVARQPAAQPPALVGDLLLLLPPAALAVAGASPAQVEAALMVVASENAALVASMRQHSTDTNLLSSPLTAAEEILQRGGATTERLATRDSLRSQFENAVTGQRAAREELRAALVEELGDAVGSDNALLAERWATNALRKAPDHFKVLDLDAEQWRLLESAWRRAERGEELSGPQAAALAAAESSTVAVTAQQRLATFLPATVNWMNGVVAAPSSSSQD